MLKDRQSLLDAIRVERLKHLACQRLDPLEDSPAGRLARRTARRYKRKIGYVYRNARKVFLIGADGSGKSSLMTGLNPAAKVIPNLATFRGRIVYKVAKKIAK